MDQVRIGVIGLGIMGELYVKIYSAHPLAQVIAVCSRRQERVEEIRARYAIPHGYTEYRKMLERKDLDAVVIATPDKHHFAPARDVLESGKHAFVEKPFTTSTAEADQLIRIAKRTGKQIQVAFNHRWLSAYHENKNAHRLGRNWNASGWLRAEERHHFCGHRVHLLGWRDNLRLVPFLA